MSLRSATPTPEQRQRRLDHVLSTGMRHMALARGRAAPTGVGGVISYRAAPIGTLEVANRGVPDHARAIAVLAYTNLWDKFISWELRGRTTHNLHAFADKRAELYAPVFAFFAPFNELQKVFPEMTSETSISVALPERNPNPRFSPACNLVLRVNGFVMRDSSTTWASEIASNFINPAGQRAQDLATGAAPSGDRVDHAGLRTWQAALNRLIIALERSTTATGINGLPHKLFRGLSQMPFVTVDEELVKTLESFSSVYTSTSSKHVEAMRFANETVPDGASTGSWLVELTVLGEGVRYIDVLAVLPTNWACWAIESEIILAPGAFYEYTKYTRNSNQALNKEVQVVEANVTATHRELPANILILPTSMQEASEMLVNATRDDREDLVHRLLLAENAHLVNPDYRNVQPNAENLSDPPLWRMTALAWAVYKTSKHAIVDALLKISYVDISVDLNMQSLKAFPHLLPPPYRHTSRHYNIKQGTALMLSSHVNNTNLLIEADADVNAKTTDGMFTPLNMASRLGLENIVESLLKNGANVYDEDSNKRTALHHAAGNSVTLAGWTLDNLVGAGASVNAKDSQGQTPLHLAAGVVDINTVRFLLQNGATIDARNNNQWTPLMVAAENGESVDQDKVVELVKLLLRRGANRVLTNTNGDTAELIANNLVGSHRMQGHAQIEEVLHSFAVEVDPLHAKDNNGNTPLHMAVKDIDIKTVRWMLQNGAIIDARNNNEWTPLMMAAENEENEDEEVMELVQLLLRHGANRVLINDHGHTAEQIAHLANSFDVEEELHYNYDPDPALTRKRRLPG